MDEDNSWIGEYIIMGTKSIRLNTILNFDEATEKDIIEVMNQLSSSHRTGEFLSNLIRLAADNPETIYKRGERYKEGPTVEAIRKSGLSQSRDEFFKDITKAVRSMKKKVDVMYDMCFNMYVLANSGNKIGIKQKTDNMIMAQFLVEKQLKDIKRVLGMESLDGAFSSDKNMDYEAKAAEVMEVIVNSYDSLIRAINEKTQVKVTEVKVPIAFEPQTVIAASSASTTNTLNASGMSDAPDSLNVDEKPAGSIEADSSSVKSTSTNTLNIAPVELLADEDDKGVEFDETYIDMVDDFFG